jgi:peptidoglycan/LPS O-acetylase OafA/YrhL
VEAEAQPSASEVRPGPHAVGPGSHADSVQSEVGYIPAIEGLRGIAVLWVVLFHYVVVRSGQFPDPLTAWVDASTVAKIIIRNGYLGVDLFFLITGFLLTLPWFKHAAEGRPVPSARDFYMRRARRILPAYYVQLAILFFVCLPLLNPDLWRAARGFVLGNLGLHLLFLHYMTPYSSASLSINGALWTLQLEAQYYLLLPLIAIWFVRAPYVAGATFFVASVVWRMLAAHDLQPLISFYDSIGARWNLSNATLRHFAGTQFPAYLAHFALGILCGRAWLANRTAMPRGRLAAILACIALCALLGLYAVLAGVASWLGEQLWVVIPVTMATAIWAAISRRPAWGQRVLSVFPLKFVGRISYSMYLYHLPVLYLFDKYSPPLAGLAFPGYFALIVGVSTLSFYAVERPFMRAPLRARKSSDAPLAVDRRSALPVERPLHAPAGVAPMGNDVQDK